MTDRRTDIRPPSAGEHDQWAALFRAYRDFYGLAPDEAVVQRVWSWIRDPDHDTRALLAVTDDGTVVGIAHFRRFPWPSRGAVGMYLDDLFTDPAHRGSGVGRALIGAITEIAAREGCEVVRWVTSEANTTAQQLYDAIATKTSWLTYDRPCAEGG